MVGLLLAVGIATLLAIILSAGYALVLRELRQINANLEHLTELRRAGACRLQELLRPRVIHALGDAFAPAKLGD
jgi:hypothetical protein